MATTLVLFVLVYGIVFAMGIYYINRLIARGPEGPAVEPAEHRNAGAAIDEPDAKSSSRQRSRCQFRVNSSSEAAPWNGIFRSSGPRSSALAVALYVILDGFDLGIGILFPFAGDEHERDQMMNSVAPFWDGNETWLVLGGGGMWSPSRWPMR